MWHSQRVSKLVLLMGMLCYQEDTAVMRRQQRCARRTATSAHAVRKAHVLGVADYSSVLCGTTIMTPVSILIFHVASSDRAQWSRCEL